MTNMGMRRIQIICGIRHIPLDITLASHIGDSMMDPAVAKQLFSLEINWIMFPTINSNLVVGHSLSF